MAKPILIIRFPSNKLTAQQMDAVRETMERKAGEEYHIIGISSEIVKDVVFEIVGTNNDEIVTTSKTSGNFHFEGTNKCLS